jgi:cyclopropane fatty-acyl-phospholipid synthase-like methyltransferase
MKKYVYQHNDGEMKASAKFFQSRVGDRSGNYEEDYLDMVKLLLSLNQGGSVLDIGAGIGRITWLAKDIVAETVALEPDESRWSECHRTCHDLPRCEVLCMSTSEYIRQHPDKTFDLIVLGMVLQHVSTRLAEQIMHETAQLLKPGGTAIIFTTHTLEETKGFRFSGVPANVHVDEQTFNEYAESDSRQHDKGIPVRRFSKGELTELVSRHLLPLYWRQCAYYTPEGVAAFAKRLRVDPGKLKDIGNSQFVVAQRSA